MHKQVIIMRNDLNMRKGKIAAQAAHASMGAVLSVCNYKETVIEVPLNELIRPWLIEGAFTKICVQISGEEELKELINKAKESNLPACLITDSGKTEFNGTPTVTCGCIGPADAAQIDAFTGHLKLF